MIDMQYSPYYSPIPTAKAQYSAQKINLTPLIASLMKIPNSAVRTRAASLMVAIKNNDIKSISNISSYLKKKGFSSASNQINQYIKQMQSLPQNIKPAPEPKKDAPKKDSSDEIGELINILKNKKLGTVCQEAYNKKIFNARELPLCQKIENPIAEHFSNLESKLTSSNNILKRTLILAAEKKVEYANLLATNNTCQSQNKKSQSDLASSTNILKRTLLMLNQKKVEYENIIRSLKTELGILQTGIGTCQSQKRALETRVNQEVAVGKSLSSDNKKLQADNLKLKTELAVPKKWYEKKQNIAIMGGSVALVSALASWIVSKKI